MRTTTAAEPVRKDVARSHADHVGININLDVGIAYPHFGSMSLMVQAHAAHLCRAPANAGRMP